ncbi:hypothetical protein LTR53_012748, partial [Teratosphaeriaceae sp. CCFEE 6253]
MSTPTPPQRAAQPRRMKHNGPPKRPSYRAARAFYLTLLIGVCLATYAHLTPSNDGPHHGLHKRQDYGILQTADEECRLVHRAPDQCAFIKTHCPDDEAGFAAYLDIFYCRIPHAKPVGLFLLVAWLGVLFSTIGIAASDFFCINLSTIAAILGMSESMAGVTLLAFGNGSPDVFSTFAAMSTNSGSLAVGELFGAAGFITAVVAGSMALIRPFHVARKSFIRDVGFFVVAAAFSMVFLWDGRLHLWECITMVAYYIFYVAFVVAWHWWIGRRRRRREKEAAARGHYLPPGDELEAEGEYRDDPEEVEEGVRPNVVRGMSVDEWSALEGGGTTPYVDGADEDDEEEARDRWMSELNSNMRLTRPRVHSRKNTISSVRPSLVGALEFQAVLKSLQKSRNIQTIPLHARRYSDDPSFTTAQQQDGMASPSDPAARPAFQITVDGHGSPTVERPSLTLDVPKSAPAARTRAVSANDASGLQLDPDYFGRLSQVPSREDLIDFGAPKRAGSDRLSVPGSAHSSQVPSPAVGLTPTSPRPTAPLRLDTDMRAQSQGGKHLPPPTPRSPGTRGPHGLLHDHHDHFGPRSLTLGMADSPQDSPRTVPSAKKLPRILMPRDERPRSSRAHPRTSTPATSPFPRFRDDASTPASTRPPSLHLPAATLVQIASPESLPSSRSLDDEAGATKPLSWWPYDHFSPPGTIISTLFPTIYHWGDKTWWEKMLGVVAAPSVFLLTVTLPVVENGEDEAGKGEAEAGMVMGEASYDSRRSKSMAVGGYSLGGGHSLSIGALGMGAANVATATEQHQHNYGDAGAQGQRHASFVLEPPVASPGAMHSPAQQDAPQPDPEPWNRWLTILQLFLAPLL